MDAHVTVDDDQGHRHIRLNTVSTRPTVLTESAFVFSKQAAVNAQRRQADGCVALDPTAQFPETAVLPGLIHKVPVANDRSFSEASNASELALISRMRSLKYKFSYLLYLRVFIRSFYRYLSEILSLTKV
jgi:hypothetical protein